MRIRRFLHPSRVVLALAASAALVGGFLLATSVFGGDVQNGNRIVVPPDSSPSAYTKLTAGDAAFTTFPSTFSDFALYWVGDEFNGHSLRKIVRQVVSADDGLRPQNSVKFLYGACGAENHTDGGCPYPLEIVISPYCMLPPEVIGEGTRPFNIEKVRGGADALSVGGGLRLWTGDVTVKLYASSPGLREAATGALISPNGLGPAGAQDDLPAPSPDCSSYRTVPHPAESG